MTASRTSTFRSVLITGASSGIGRALALACSAPGVVVHLCARDPERLEQVVQACRAAGADARGRVQDVRDAAGMAEWISGAGSLDLVSANAGVASGSMVGPPEVGEEARRIFATNVDGVLNTVIPAMEVMRGQPAGQGGIRGRIAVMSSTAAFVAVPGAPAYCASKSAVDAWIVGNAQSARWEGIKLTSICPGYVRTPMTEMNRFPMPGLMEPERAAELILRGVQGWRVRVTFPWWIGAAGRLGSLLPAGTTSLLMGRKGMVRHG
jgi:NAD(P)-dependent dehydrogenase (short-subunit alcohol dehydrogenase family)